jgi:hypothetical protein
MPERVKKVLVGMATWLEGPSNNARLTKGKRSGGERGGTDAWRENLWTSRTYRPRSPVRVRGVSVREVKVEATI